MEHYQVGNEMSPESRVARAPLSTRGLRIMLALLAAMCMLVLTANAQVPRTISYQGVLTNGGTAANGPHIITVALYDSLEGGTQLYQESHQLTVTNGIFDMEIGSISPLPPTLTFNAPYYLGVSIDGSAELSPRVPLDAAPYALNAGTAQLAEGLTSDAHGVVTSINELAGALRISGDSITTITENGNEITIHAKAEGIQSIASPDKTIAISNGTGPNVTVGVADSAITTAKLANSAVTPQKLAQAGAAKGQILKWNGSAWAVANDSVGSTSYLAGQGISISGNTISAAGGLPAGTVLNSTLRWNGTTWVENQNMTSDANGNTHINGATNLGDGNGADNITMSPGAGQIQVSGWTTGVVMSSAAGVLSTSQLSGGAGISITQNANAITIADTGSVGWALTGNTGTSAPTNFLGTIDNQAFEIHINNNDGAGHGSKRVLRFEPNATSANIIAGYQGNAANANVVGATIAGGGLNGYANTVTDDFGVVGGGSLNRAGNNSGSNQDASHATVAGGGGNTASGIYSSILGGTGNTASGSSATVGGGSSNQATGAYATVTGGIVNVASDSAAVVGGAGNRAGKFAGALSGLGNDASGDYAVISGGISDTASGYYSTIGGGGTNKNYSDWGTIAGGGNNTISATGPTIGGGYNNLSNSAYTVISGGINNSTVGTYASIAGGRDLTLGSNSFGVNVNGNGNTIDLSANQNLAYFGDMDLWLGNVDNSARAIRFYAPGSSVNYSTRPYSAFLAGSQSATINYTLPITQPTANQVLAATAISGTGPYAVTLGWANNSGGNTAWNLTGNSGTTPGTNFLGTTDNTAMEILVRNNGVIANALILNPNGSVQHDTAGNARGANAIDLQNTRTAATQIASGANAFIGGGANNTASGQYSVVGGGENNLAVGQYATVSGGYSDTVEGDDDVVGGGRLNSIQAGYSAIVGGGYANRIYKINAGDSIEFSFIGTGNQNLITNGSSSIVGGWVNTITGGSGLSFIGGGQENFITSTSSTLRSNTIAGGYSDSISGELNFVGGGHQNAIAGSRSTIAGGDANKINGNLSTIAGGFQNILTGGSSVIAGGWANVMNNTNICFIGSGLGNNITDDGSGNGARASAIAGGEVNSIIGDHNLIGGGANNYVTGNHSTVSGGYADTVNADYGFVGGGQGNAVTGTNSTISGGWYNKILPRTDGAPSDISTIGGGWGNSISVGYSTIGGGWGNSITGLGELSFIGGGLGNNISEGTADSANTIAGGKGNSINTQSSSWGGNSAIGGGQYNSVTGNWATLSGGQSNTVGGDYSAIPGGTLLELDGTGSFGFNNPSSANDNAVVTAGGTAYFGNTNVWLGNTNDTASQLRFYEAQSSTGAFPAAGTNFTAFQAGSQSADITYTLPTTIGTADQVLAISSVSGTAAQLGWAAAGSGSGWGLTGNSGTTDGTNFLGTTDNVPFTIRTNNVQALRIQPYHNAVPSTIGGGSGNTIASGDTASFIGFGDSNRIGASYSSILGGNSDTVTGDYSTISAGYGNTVTGEVSAISGGAGNSVTSDFSMIAGGYLDTIPGTYDGFVGGGAYNVVKDENGAIAGGVLNTAYLNAFVGGGIANLAGAFSHSGSAVLGGEHNTAAGDNSIIAGGQGNQIPLSALYSGVLAGVDNYAGGSNSAIVGGGYLRMTGDNSFGFHAGSSSTDSANIATANTAYFGNVNLWLGNTNNSASELRFYGAQNGGVTFPGASTHYSGFAAAGQLADINYTLPSTQPTANQVLAATAISGSGPYAVTLGWANNGSGTTGVIYGPTSLQSTLTTRSTPLYNIAYSSTASDGSATGAEITSSAGASGNYNATGLTVSATGTGTGNTTGISVSASGSSGTVRAIDATGKINIDDASSYDIGGTPYLWEADESLFIGNTGGWPNRSSVSSANICIGLLTASNLSSGYSNVVLGNYAGASLSNGENNTIVGSDAGTSTSSGIYNTFVGDESGYSNSNGHDNAYFGHEAGYGVEGDSNSFFGSSADGKTDFGYTGSNNSLFGYHSGFEISSGTNNTIMGSMAGQSTTTGSGNTLLGAGSNISSGSLTNAAAIGYHSYVGASNSMVLGSINGINGATANTYVGIGTTTPSYPLHSVYSGTTDEITAIYGNATGSTTNQAIGVWGDASNTTTTNTGTIGVLATGNGNTTEGQTNVALQINDGEFAMGRTTEAPGTGTDVEPATGGTAYTQQGPSGIIELTLGAAGNLTTSVPTSGTIQDLGYITINNRYCEVGSIVLVNVVGMIDDGSAPNPQNAAWIVNADNTTGGSFVVRIKMIPTVTSVTNYSTSDKVRIGYMIVNKSR